LLGYDGKKARIDKYTDFQSSYSISSLLAKSGPSRPDNWPTEQCQNVEKNWTKYF